MGICDPQFRSGIDFKPSTSSCLCSEDSAAMEIYNVDAAARKHLGLKGGNDTGEQLSLREE
jgi:hypothetical protein